jgi:branched-chain amino acid transport system ATP-binding protein
VVRLGKVKGTLLRILEIVQVSKMFDGFSALRNVDVAVEAGDIHAVIGPNGAGKTTLFNLVSGFYPASTGEIRFKGKNVTQLKSHQIARLGVSRTFQNIYLFPQMTVLENVMVGAHMHSGSNIIGTFLRLPFAKLESEQIMEKKAIEFLHFVGLDQDMTQPASSLPYGSQRRLEIARALATEPALLLLDEPAAGMNPAETDSLLELIRKINGSGITVLLIEHHMQLVTDISKRITVLNFGEKISEGTPDEIQNDEKVIEAYIGREG